MRCPLCGFEFSKDEAECHEGCPFREGCSLYCCPNCGYRMVDEEKSTLARLARKAGSLLRRRGEEEHG